MSQVIGCGFGFSGGGGSSSAISGTGTPPKMPVFTGANTLGDSQMSDNGTTVFIGASATSTSAMFEVKSTTQGALFPRMTTAERDLIPVGATEDSLFIYNTTSQKFNYYDNISGAWITVESSIIGGETWAETLTNGAISGGVSPQMSDGDVLKAVNGGGELNLRDGADGQVSLSSDNGGMAQGWFYASSTVAEFGYGTDKSSYSSLGVLTVNGSAGVSISSSGSNVNLQPSNTNSVGIGTDSPTSRLDVVGSAGSTSRVGISRYSTNAAAGGIVGKKARGTEAAPTVISSGDRLLNIIGSGYDGAAFFNQNASIYFQASENFSPTQGGTQMVFGTTAIGGTTVTDRMVLTADGILGIGSSTTPNTSALIDMGSTTQGFLVPRMTAAQRVAIASPATGLLVYQTDGTAGFYYYDGALGAWYFIGTNGIYGGSGTTPTSTVVSLTDTFQIIDDDTSNILTFGSGTAILDLEFSAGSVAPFTMYENRVGGAIVGDNYSVDFFFNDSTGAKTLGGSIANRVDAAPTAGDVNMSMTLNGIVKIQPTGRVLMTTGALTGGAIANLEVRAGAGTGNTTLLVKSNGTTASQIVMWAQNSSSQSLYYLDATAKHFHNVSQLTTGDFNARGGTDVNLLYTNAGTNRVGIGLSAPSSKLHIQGAGATSSTTSLIVENSGGTDILVVRDDVRVGVGVTSPTASLHILAGTSTANTAPLKFTTGVLNSTAETGAMEFASDFFYLTANSIRSAISTFGRTVVTTASYTVLITDRILGVEYTDTGACTLNLPAAALFPNGYKLTAKDEGLNASVNNITIDPSGAETIDGAADAVINGDGDSLTFYSNGVDAWFLGG